MIVWITSPVSWVALLAEGVDRNSQKRAKVKAASVALLAEGVDRNSRRYYDYSSRNAVALLAEGVDRNYDREGQTPEKEKVALLAEGVDRNFVACSAGLPARKGRPPRGGRG